MNQVTDSGYAPVNGVDLYWESYGTEGAPLIVVPGGFGLISMLHGLIDPLAARRRVIVVELQGHGHTADIDRPFSYEAFGDDVAGLIEYLGLGQADLLGYSLGAQAVLRAAVQHPDLARKLAIVSMPFKREGWYPEVLAAFDQMSSANFPMMKQTPLYQGYSQVAPDPDAFPRLMDKTGELQRQPYDWSDDLRRLTVETLLVYADADSVPVTHIAEFYALLGGGLQDASWDGSGRPKAQLAILPGLTHYDIFGSPRLVDLVNGFFDGSLVTSPA